MSSLNKRKDYRTKKQFAQDIAEYTEKEGLWSIALQKDLIERGHEVSIHEHGVDNSGNLIEGKLDNYNADKRFIVDGEDFLVEVKTVPEWCTKFFTFKTFVLEQCLKQKANILVPKLKEYFIFYPSAIEIMLTYPSQIYYGFSPNDPAVRINMSDILALVNIRRLWLTDAKKFIKKHKAKL